MHIYQPLHENSPIGVSCGVWLQDIGGRLFGSCGLRRRVSVDRTHSDWDLGSLGVRLAHRALRLILEPIPECFFLWCDWAYCRRWGRWQCLHRMLLSWGNVLWSICTSARIQGFPAEHCILMRWSVLFTSPVCGFNAGADKCKSACSPCIDWGINKEL